MTVKESPGEGIEDTKGPSTAPNDTNTPGDTSPGPGDI